MMRKIVRGTYPTLKRLPPAPDLLREEGKAEWKRAGNLLISEGILTAVDTRILEVYCRYYELWQEFDQMVKRDGMIMTAPNGRQVPSLAVMLSHEACDRMLFAAKQLGMTPASLAKLPQTVPAATDRRPALSGVRPDPRLRVDD